MKDEAEPTTMPPAIGAWSMSLMIIVSFMRIEIIDEPITEAAMPRRRQPGPVMR